VRYPLAERPVHAEKKSASGQVDPKPVPVILVCTFFNRESKLPSSFLKTVSGAQPMLKSEFAEHKCNRENASQTTPSSTK